MANAERVEIVRRGADAIAEWREEHPGERLDLFLADLRMADIRDADLRDANLSRANLLGADLGQADLRQTLVVQTSFCGTSLIGTTLAGANMTNACLMGTDLRKADLSWAICQVTTFANCDLSRVHGLQDVRHLAPSSIGVDTLARTLEGEGGHFTREQRTFFVNAGVPKSLLDYLPSLLQSDPIQFFSCFISYGSEDEKFADRLYRDLKERGVSCWKYDEDALVGRGAWANIDRAIAVHEKAVVICSESSLQRPGVQREIERALQHEDELTLRQAAQPDVKIDTDVLFPVRLDDYVLEGWEHPRKADVIAKHIGDFRGWDEDDANYQRGLDQLLRALDPRSKLGLTKGDLRELAPD